ncbi:hypothetical protein EGM51_09930 [Verrucomicrobia bacterium S94]|nr:hypothetical protein EGM51_09930 [Verrucomicrobia bacterium S94]
MIKNLFIITMICAFATACSTTKEETQTAEPIPEKKLQKEPIPEALSAELLTQIQKTNFDISVSEQSLSPNGSLILVLEENEIFTQGATIKIPKESLKELSGVFYKLKTVVSISSKNGKGKIKSLQFTDETKVAVAYE